MAAARTTSDYDTQIYPTSYSTLFSNRLIDLAISVDTEVTTGKSKLEREEIIDNRGLRILDNPNCQAIGKKSSIAQRIMGTEKRKHGTAEVPTANIRQHATNGLSQPDQPYLLTVFSSPCTDYFSNSSRTSLADSDDELPEYVRSMMENDTTLQRLVKTGSVTISKVKQETRNNEDKYLLDNEEEFYPSDGDEDDHGGYGVKKNVPPGNIHEWEEFPYAKRLLELAHMSLSLCNGSKSLVASKPVPVQVRTKKRLPPHSKGKAKPLSKSNISAPERFQKVLPPTKSRMQIRKVAPKCVRALAPLKPAQAKLDKKMTTKKSIVSPLSVGRKSLEDDQANFQMDPMKFLEVSLKEGKVPDDSHRRKYECKFCEKKFCWSTDLKRHTLIHTGERPFKCPECPANFTRKFLMQKHVKKVHDDTRSSRPSNHPNPATAEEDFYSVATFVDDSGDELDEIKTEFKEEEFEDFDMGEDDMDEYAGGDVKFIDF